MIDGQEGKLRGVVWRNTGARILMVGRGGRTTPIALLTVLISQALFVGLPAQASEPPKERDSLSTCLKAGNTQKICMSRMAPGDDVPIESPKPGASEIEGNGKTRALDSQSAAEVPLEKQPTPGPKAETTRPSTKSSSASATTRSGQMAAGARAISNPHAITFSEYELGTRIGNQYQGRGIHFGGNRPFVTDDSAQPTSPVLSGSPRFFGRIDIKIVNPLNGQPSSVKTVEFDVGYIDSANSLEIIHYSRQGKRLGITRPNLIGINHIRLDSPGGARAIRKVTIRADRDEPAGFAIDNVKVSILERFESYNWQQMSEKDSAIHLMSISNNDFVKESRSIWHDSRLNWNWDSCTPPSQVDLIWRQSFRDACRRHDFGYNNFGKRMALDKNEDRRAFVDATFYNDMLGVCARRNPISGISCNTSALAFYNAVRVGGRRGFHSN
jgi:hypothetical protein